MTIHLTLVAIFCLNPVEDVVRDKVDAMEVNHFYNENGTHVHDQVIFWEWGLDGRWQPRGYRVVRDHHLAPLKDWQRGTYAMT